MKTSVLTPMLLLLVGCTSPSNEELSAVFSSKTLVATTDMQLVAIGHKLSDPDRDRLYRHFPSTLDKIDEDKPLALQDIKNLTRSGVSDDVIIHEIHATRSIFYLTPSDEQELREAGVSNRVIYAMIETSEDRY